MMKDNTDLPHSYQLTLRTQTSQFTPYIKRRGLEQQVYLPSLILLKTSQQSRVGNIQEV